MTQGWSQRDTEVAVALDLCRPEFPDVSNTGPCATWPLECGLSCDTLPTAGAQGRGGVSEPFWGSLYGKGGVVSLPISKIT